MTIWDAVRQQNTDEVRRILTETPSVIDEPDADWCSISWSIPAPA